MSDDPLQQLAGELNALVQKFGYLPLERGTIDSPSVQALFDGYLRDKTFRINDPTVGIPTGLDWIEIDGVADESAEPFCGMKVSGRITRTTQFELLLDGTSDSQSWNLADAFPFFAGQRPFSQITIFSPELVLDSTCGGTLNFSGNVSFTGVEISALGSIFPGVNTLGIAGEITSISKDEHGVPQFNFSGTSDTAVTVGGFRAFKPGLSLTHLPLTKDGPPVQRFFALWNLTFDSSQPALPIWIAWPFDMGPLSVTVVLDQAVQFAFGALTTLTGGQQFGSMLPTQLTMPSKFGLLQWTMEISPVDLSVVSYGLLAGTPPDWKWTISDTLVLQNLTVSFEVDTFGSLSVWVQAILGIDTATLVLRGGYPAFAFSGALRAGSSLDLRAAVAHFFPSAADILPKLPLSELDLLVDPGSSNYSLHTVVGSAADPWTISFDLPGGTSVAFELTGVELDLALTAAAFSVEFGASMRLGQLSGVRSLDVSAAYATAAGWTITAELENLEASQLTDIVNVYFPPLAELIKAVDLEEINLLKVVLNPTTKRYSFLLDVIWVVPITGDDSLRIEAVLDLESGPGAPPSTITGTFTYNETLTITASAVFTSPVTISFQWSDFTATYQKPVATFHFGDQALGSVISTMVQAVTPGNDFALVEPWNLLNSIVLPALTITIDFTKKTATFTLAVSASLPFGSLDSVSVTTHFGAPANRSVVFLPTGTILGQNFSQGWDVLQPGTTPQIAGFGSGVFHLQFLGLGQHVADSAMQTDTIADAVTSLRADFRKPPWEPGSTLGYSASTNWIVAVEALLLDGSISVAGLFLDPEMYGVSIYVSPNGKAAEFAGLRCDILYKQITPTIGLYQGNLTLPESVRYLQFGAVSIALPSISLDIYTNGNFRIDLGFPTNDDFSHSFGIQMLPWVGAGGFYFGVLDGATAVDLPANVTNGTFNPVITFGIGLAVGIGKTIQYGILSGGMTLMLQGIIQGTLATFNEFGSSDDARYYSVQGKAAIVGHIFGEVNFVVIVARFDVTVTISVALEIVAFEPINVTFTASLSVSASISINLGFFSITIGFSFSLSFSESFTVGSFQPTPWNGTSLEPASWQALRLSRAARQLDAAELRWVTVETDPKLAVDLILTPHFTSASEIAGGIVAPAKARLVVMTYVARAKDGTTGRSDFEKIAEGTLLWAIAALLANGENITLTALRDMTIAEEQLESIAGALASPAGAAPFDLDDVQKLFDGSFDFTFVDPAAPDGNVTVFPLMPGITLARPDGTKIDFTQYHQLDAQQLQAIKDYFNSLQPSTPGMTAAARSLETEPLSLATFLFLDYFTALAKATIQSAIDAVRNGTTLGHSALDQIARKHDLTLGTLARSNRLLRLCPGAILEVPATRLRAARKHTVADAPSETLIGVARRFGTTVEELAAANASLERLFHESARIFVGPASRTVGGLVDGLRSAGAFDAPGGQVARILLQGLRPPWTDGTVTAPQALYQISGQQSDVSGLEAGKTFTLTLPAAPGTMTITITPEYKQIIDKLDGAVLTKDFSSAPQPFYNTIARRFTLSAPVAWELTAGSTTEPEKRTIWNFPANLLQLLAADPGLEPKVLLGEEAKVASFLPRRDLAGSVGEVVYQWATSLRVTVQRIPSSENPGQPIPRTYELIGTDDEGGDLLQRLIAWSTTHNAAALIDQIYTLFPAPGLAGTPSHPTDGVRSNAVERTSFFVVQTNLSTASHPAEAVVPADEVAATPVPPLGMAALDMLRLVWECSIVRSGGYDFYYSNKTASGSEGLPDSLFDADGEAQLTLVVTYTIADDVLLDFLNCVVIVEPADPKAIRYLQAVEKSIPALRPDGETLQEIASSRRATLYELVSRNADARLSAGNELALPPANGESPSVLALDAPESLAGLAARHGLSLAALANANRDRPLRFEDGLTLDPILLDRAPAINAGYAGFTATLDTTQARVLWRGDTELTREVAETGVAEIYHLLSYEIAENSAFHGSTPGIPLAPAGTDADRTVTYSAVIPVAPFANQSGSTGPAHDPPPDDPAPPDPSADPYRGIGQQVDIALTWLDIFGNRITTAPSSAYNVPVDLRYFDRLLGVGAWPGVVATYVIARDAQQHPALTATFYFDTNRYDPTAGGSKEMAASDAGTFALAYYQLVHDTTVTLASSIDPAATPDLTATAVDFILRLYTFAANVAKNGWTATAPIVAAVAVPVADSSGLALFPLTVSVTIQRTKFVEETLDDPLLDPIRIVTTPMRPAYQAAAAQKCEPPEKCPPPPPATLQEFARGIQDCFDTLMPATGRTERNAAPGDASREIWLVRFGSGGFTCRFGTPYFFALKPLATEPYAASAVPILLYTTGQVLSPSLFKKTAFADVDLDLLARNALTALDQFLSPDFAVPAWRIANGGPASGPNPVTSILGSKQALATAIASESGIAAVYADQTDATTASLTAASARLTQDLLVRLAMAYEIDTLVQFAVTATGSDLDPGLAPALYGKPVVATPPPAAGEAPAYSMSTATVPLTTTPDASFLTFTFTARHKSEASVVTEMLAFDINNFEYDIRDVPGAEPYRAASWLTFILPFSQASPAVRDAVSKGALGPVDIPIPLRAFPTPPALMSQDALAAPAGSLDSVKQWSYGFTYNYIAAAQDRIYIDVTYNIDPPVAMALVAEEPDLPTALLQFNAVWPAILADLRTYVLVPGTNDDFARTAMGSLAFLAGQLAKAWTRHFVIGNVAAEDEPPVDSIVISQDSVDLKDEPGVLVLTVTRTAPLPGFLVPLVTIDGGYVTEIVSRDDQAAAYRYWTDASETGHLLYEDALAIGGRSLTMPSHDVLALQKAWGAASVTRNECYGGKGIIGADCDGGRRGNSDFFYRTPPVRYITAAVPLIDSALPIDLAAFATPGSPLVDYLNGFLRWFFTVRESPAPESAMLRFTCDYESVIGAAVPFTIGMPILMTLPASVAPGVPEIARMADLAVVWLRERGLLGGSGTLRFVLSMFASSGLATLPLLQLTEISIAVNLIDG